MPGRILIIDPIATNRILLKVRLSASNYQVLVAENGPRGVSIAKSSQPDLILVDDAILRPDPPLLRALKAAHDCPVIVLTPHDAPRADYLTDGAEDCLLKPVDDVLLLARLRTALRDLSVPGEGMLRSDTGTALGFAEGAAGFAPHSTVAVISADAERAARWTNELRHACSASVTQMPVATVLGLEAGSAAPDLFVIDLTGEGQTGLELITEMRAHPATRGSSILAMVPEAMPVLAAMAYDLGAQDVMQRPFEPTEASIRITNGLKRKHSSDHIRDTVRQGLRAAVTDPLTGLHNRRYAQAHLQQIAAKAQAHNLPYALLVIDIDRFKLVNDSHGHAAGDEVLKALSAALSDNLRSDDMIARMGGEEFLVALPDTGRIKAQVIAERLRKMISELSVPINAQTTLRVSASIGIAVSDPESQPMQDPLNLLETADAALYSSKDAGRNRVTLSPSAA